MKETVLDILKNTKTIAVVGLSDNPARSSYGVADYLSRYYKIVPVNPNLSKWQGMQAYPSISAIPSDIKIDLVNIFRRSEDVPPVVNEAITRKVPYIWMQQGIINTAAEADAHSAGALVVMDSCIAVEHAKQRPNLGK